MVNWIIGTKAGKMLSTFLISMVPVIELRVGLPYGIALGLEYPLALISAVLGNMLPVPFVIIFIEKIFAWMRTRYPKLNGLVTRLEERAGDKSELVEKIGPIGLCLFVAIPLPGTGAWTGALIAACMNLKLKHSIPAIFLGVIIASMIMTAVTFGVIHVL